MGTELSSQEIKQKIYFIRGHRVMLDSDLAALYEVETKVLNRSVRRHMDRFPDDFMLHLTATEYESLRCQIGTLKKARGGHRKYLPFVFTQEGVAMLSGVLSSSRAIQVNITIMRAFVKLREILETDKDLARKIDRLEQRFSQHDHQLKTVFEAIRQLMAVGSTVTRKKVKALRRDES